MRSLFSNVLKNNQVTYGRPFQVRVPLNLQNIAAQDSEEEESENIEDICELPPKPEELLEEAKKDCDLLIKDARLKADKLLEQAGLEAKKKAEDLLEEAWQKGYAEGMEAAQAQNEAILAETEQIRKSAEQEHDSIMAGLESEIVELVLEIAHKAVAGELTTNSEVILQLIRDALPNCSNKNGAIIKVSSIDCDFINDNKEGLSSIIESTEGLEIRKDSTLKPGDCIIETLLGSVDAGANTRLNKIEEAFREQLYNLQK